MNAENLLKVKAMILEEPKRFNMKDFVITGTKSELEAAGVAASPCSTVACIAGWGAIVAQLEQSPRIKHAITAARLVASYASSAARDFFEISEASSDDLFYESHWPRDLSSALHRKEPGTAGYAQAAAAAIDRFIACDGNWYDDKGPAPVLVEVAR